MENHKYTNDLIHETSPYLLQHAHNPVNWHAWNDETLALAKKENTQIFICIDGACKLPLTSSTKAIEQLNISYK